MYHFKKKSVHQQLHVILKFGLKQTMQFRHFRAFL